jgi:Aromatic amino acid lyase
LQLSGILQIADGTDAAQNHFQDIHETAQLLMPELWVRGAILTRCNSLLRGHSGVRLEVTDSLLKLLHHDLIPRVPLRGSLSSTHTLLPL